MITCTCDVCGHTFYIEMYDEGECPSCKQKYEYDEKIHIVLSDKQLELLRLFQVGYGG